MRQTLHQGGGDEHDRRGEADRDVHFRKLVAMLAEVADRLQVVQQQVRGLGDIPALARRALRSGGEPQDVALGTV